MNKCIKDNYPEWAWNEPRMTDNELRINDRTSEAPVIDWTTNPSVLSADRNMKNNRWTGTDLSSSTHCHVL